MSTRAQRKAVVLGERTFRLERGDHRQIGLLCKRTEFVCCVGVEHTLTNEQNWLLRSIQCFDSDLHIVGVRKTFPPLGRNVRVDGFIISCRSIRNTQNYGTGSTRSQHGVCPSHELRNAFWLVDIAVPLRHATETGGLIEAGVFSCARSDSIDYTKH